MTAPTVGVVARLAVRLPARLAALAAAGTFVLAGCTGDHVVTEPPDRPILPGELRLASFDSCSQALGDLRKAMRPFVGAYGIGGFTTSAGAGGAVEDAAAAPGAERAAAPAQEKSGERQYSSTNTHEAGVDEPDIVKTDGQRIVTVVDGSLRIVDVASRKLTGTLALPQPNGMDELLLAGDRALVIRRGGFHIMDLPQRGGTPDIDSPMPAQSELLLVELAGTPRVLATFGIDGRFVDARMVGQTVRVVAHSQPRMDFVMPAPDRPADEALRKNKEILDSSPIEAWLPQYRLERDGSVQTGRVDCTAVARPASYTATSMLTVLSFDLAAPTLGTGDPVTVVADGETVYGTADSLYVASNTSRLVELRPVPDQRPVPGAPDPLLQERTELYKFDTSGPGRPRHVASGAVPGTLLNQYSMSEYDGHLRVATTARAGFGQVAGSGAEPGKPGDDPSSPSAVAPDRIPVSESTVYVLAQRGSDLAIAGKVGGLGKGEQIYAVRFAGPVGYVVTFRQTDPLYTLDLRNPASPKVTGELKITGYSAYLHPAGDGRVIGVGQEASEQGRVQGTQVSLFDVSDPAAPRRLAQYHVPNGSSEAEYDPHAFLYWPATSTLVLPISSYRPDLAGGMDGGALVLRVGDAQFTEVGTVRQPAPAGQPWPQPIRRSLVVDDTLWTVSERGLAANGIATLDARGWVGWS